MALTTINNIRVNYNVIFDRLSIVSTKDFVSLTQRSFNIFMNMIKSKSLYDKIILTQSKSELEILQLCGNFVLRFQSFRNFTNIIIIKEKEANHIFNNQFKINEAIESMKQNHYNRGESVDMEKLGLINKKRCLDNSEEILDNIAIDNG